MYIYFEKREMNEKRRTHTLARAKLYRISRNNPFSPIKLTQNYLSPITLPKASAATTSLPSDLIKAKHGHNLSAFELLERYAQSPACRHFLSYYNDAVFDDVRFPTHLYTNSPTFTNQSHNYQSHSQSSRPGTRPRLENRYERVFLRRT